MRIIRSKDFLKSYKQKLDEASRIKALKYEYTTRYGTPKAGTSLRRHVLDKKAEELSSRGRNPNTAPDGKQPIGAAGYRAGLSAAHMQGRIPYSGSRPTHTERRGVKKPRGAKFSDWVPSDIDKRNEEFELWVNSLVNEGYDLSEYTWDDVYEIYETYSDYLTVQAFLIGEGYADSIQESDYMIENMNEDLIDAILNEVTGDYHFRNWKPLSPRIRTRIENQANAAYNDVVNTSRRKLNSSEHRRSEMRHSNMKAALPGGGGAKPLSQLSAWKKYIRAKEEEEKSNG